MIREHSPQSHCPCMQYSFMAEAAQTRMSVNNLDLFSNENVSENRKAGEDSWECSGAIDDEKWDMIDFETISEISYTGSPLVCMRYNYDFMSSIDELGGELVDVAFYSSRLGKEEIADHCDIVRHIGGYLRSCGDQLVGAIIQGQRRG